MKGMGMTSYHDICVLATGQPVEMVRFGPRSPSPAMAVANEYGHSLHGNLSLEPHPDKRAVSQIWYIHGFAKPEVGVFIIMLRQGSFVVAPHKP